MLRKRIAMVLAIACALSITTLGKPMQTPVFDATQVVENNVVEFNTRLQVMEKLRDEAIQKRIDEEHRIKEEAIRLENERLIEIESNRAKEVTYNPYDILTPSNLNEDEVYQILEGSALQTLSRGYYYVEQITGINLLFLVALNSEESARGESSLAISRNNLGGVISRSGDYAYFEDWYDSLMYIAELLKTEYLSPDGNYYNGSSIWNVNTRYCLLADGVTTDYNWSDKINSIAYEYLEKIN